MRTKREIDLAIAFTRLELDKMQNRVAQMRRSLLLKEYNPNQPRIPARQTGGGRWTRNGQSTDSHSRFYVQLNESIQKTSLMRVKKRR